MATLGDKVTQTLISAIGKGLEGALEGQHEDIKKFLELQADIYSSDLSSIPQLKDQIEIIKAPSNLGEIITSLLFVILGLHQTIFALGEPGTEMIRQGIWMLKPVRLPMPPELVQARFRGMITPADLSDALHKAGYSETYRLALEEVYRPLINEDDLRDLLLRGEIGGADWVARMGKRGWAAMDQLELRKLHWIIPNAQDLIRMAVREAFTPYAIENYGLGTAFPEAFATYAEKIGLSREWAQRYWYAHWVLPSIGQGYEMMQRGVIDEKTLRDLLTYADVLPWWHDKIIKIAYRTLTRVDVRRMYQLGVLDREGVKKSYRELGYDEPKAEQMTLFTLKYTSQAERDLTKADIVSGFGKGILSKGEAEEMLTELGYDEDEISFYLAQDDLKNAETTRDLTLSYLKSLYLEGVLDKPTTTARLAEAGYEQNDILLLYALWEKEAPPKTAHPSRADLDSFLSNGIIDEDTYIEEMWNLGYSERYISWYLSRATGSK